MIFYFTVFLLFSVYALWTLYLAVMNLKRVKDVNGLTTITKVLGYPLLFLGLFFDFIVNVFVVSLILLEFPREFTVTSRLKRHNTVGTGWRKAVAKWFEPILDPFDPSGNHI